MRYCTMCWDAQAQEGSPYCAACAKIQNRILKAKEERAKRKPIEKPESLDDDVALIEEINRKHGAHLSYGRYRAKMEGRL